MRIGKLCVENQFEIGMIVDFFVTDLNVSTLFDGVSSFLFNPSLFAWLLTAHGAAAPSYVGLYFDCSGVFEDFFLRNWFG